MLYSPACDTVLKAMEPLVRRQSLANEIRSLAMGG